MRPFREKVQRLSLELMQFDVRTGETYSIARRSGAGRRRLHGQDRPLRRGHPARGRAVPRRAGATTSCAPPSRRSRGTCAPRSAAHSIEDVYRERAKLVAATKELAEPDLDAMGLEVVSLTIRQIADKQGYLEALGRPRTAQVKRDAVRGEAEAEREAKAARYAADTAIEESRRDYELQKSLVQGRGPAGPRRGRPLLRPPAGDHPAAGARPGAPGRDRRAPEGDRADGGRGRSAASTSSRPR